MKSGFTSKYSSWKKSLALTILITLGSVNSLEKQCVDLVLQKAQGNAETNTCLSTAVGPGEIIVNGLNFTDFCPEEQTECEFEYCLTETAESPGNFQIQTLDRFAGIFFFRIFVKGKENTAEAFFLVVCESDGSNCAQCDDGKAFVLSQNEPSLSINVTEFLNIIPDDLGGINVVALVVPIIVLLALLSVLAAMRRVGAPRTFAALPSLGSKTVESRLNTVDSKHSLLQKRKVTALKGNQPSSFLTFNSTQSKKSQFRNNKESLRSDYLAFRKDSVVAVQSSKLTYVLNKQFSRRDQTLSQASSSFVPDLEMLKPQYPARATYASTVSDSEKLRYERLKTLSIRFSDGFQRLNSLLGFDILKKEENKIDLKTQEFVNRVCDVLKTQILAADEVEALESGYTKQFRARKAFFRLFNFNKKRAHFVELSTYLFKLVSGLNKWFAYDGGLEVVGIRSLIIALIYLRKIKSKESHFTLTVFNVHRLFAVLMLLASKFTEDDYIPNGYWSDVCAISINELNSLEEDFAFSSDFDFSIDPEELFELYQEFELDLREIGVDSKELTKWKEAEEREGELISGFDDEV